jgi:ribose transport system substrate-binding protein
MANPGSRYTVRSVVHASKVLAAFQNPGEVLRLRDIVARTGFDKGTAYRLLYTLHLCDLIEKVGTKEYRSAVRVNRRSRFRIGYASDGQNCSFTRAVTDGLVHAAESEGIEVIVADYRSGSKTALRAADELIKENVDLIIECQTDHNIAPVIASRCVAVNIPMIAVEVPHPGATYFGANNYEAGLIGGRYLGKWAQKHWAGSVDEIVLVEQRCAGPLPGARLTGLVAGLKEILPGVTAVPAVWLDGDCDFGRTLKAVRNHLRFRPAKKTLVGTMDDVSALGALRAFEEAGRIDRCAVLSHNASPEGRAELRRPQTRLIGSVAYFPEKYGESLVRLALDILEKKPVPPAVFVRHRLVTAQNVDHLYPNDALIGV